MELNISESPEIILNKSASFSGSPISEKIQVQQVFKNKKGDTLLRQYSYEVPDRRTKDYQVEQLCKYTQASGKIEKAIDCSAFNIPDVKFGSSFNHIFNFSKHIPEEKGFEKFLKQNKYEPTPMDIDTSIGSNKSLNNSFSDGPNKNDIKSKNSNTSIGSNKSLNNSFSDTPNKNDIESKNSSRKDSLKKTEKVLHQSKISKINEIFMKNDVSMSDVHDNNFQKYSSQKSKVPKLNMRPNKPADVIKSKLNQKRCLNNSIIIRLLKILCLFFVPAMFGIVFMFCTTDSVYAEDFDTSVMINQLQNLVYGQTEVIDKLEDNLNLMKNNKVFLFSGGIGVGKTYTAQIIERNYPLKKNIQKIIMTSQLQNHDLEQNIMHNLVENEHNLIIIDNLVMDDLYFILPVVSSFAASDKKFIMIVIFNLQELSEDFQPSSNLRIKGREISKIFYDNNISHSNYMFESLNADDTKQCIRFAMDQRGFAANEDLVNEVLENVDFKYSGCKGIYGKVALVD